MKNTITRPPKLPQLPDTPVLNYARTKQAKRQLAGERDKLLEQEINQAWEEEQENGFASPPAEDRETRQARETERLHTEERIRGLEEQIARTQEAGKLWEDRFLQQKIDRAWYEEEEDEPWSPPYRERKEEAYAPLPDRSGKSEEERLDRLIDEAWYEDAEYGPLVRPDWKKMLARPAKPGYDGLNGSFPPRKANGKIGPQNAILTPEEAKNAQIVPLPNYDLSGPEKVLLSLSAVGNRQPASNQKEATQTQSSSGGGYVTLDGRRVGTMAEKIKADARYRMLFRGDSADTIIAFLAGNVSAGKITAAEAAEIAEETNPVKTPTKVLVPDANGNYQPVAGYFMNGSTYLDNGSPMPEGAYVYTQGGWYTKQNNVGVPVSGVPVQIPEQGTQQGILLNNRTYLPDGTRPTEGAKVYVSDNAYWEMGKHDSGTYVAPPSPEPVVVKSTTKAGESGTITESVQAAFQNSIRGGDYDGGYGLQCVDLTRWYIDTYTTLKSTRGHGCDLAENTAKANNLPKPSTTPKAPSVYSVAPGVRAFGASGSMYGHTGIVLSVDEVNHTVTVIQTMNGLTGETTNSVISTYSYPADGVTFTYIGDYIK